MNLSRSSVHRPHIRSFQSLEQSGPNSEISRFNPVPKKKKPWMVRLGPGSRNFNPVPKTFPLPHYKKKR